MPKKNGTGPNLAQLILERKGDRTFDRLSADCGGEPAGRRLQQLAAGRREMKNFPDPETITALAKGLHVTTVDVLLASARSLGIRVATSDADSLTIAHGGQLPLEAQEALHHTARTMLKLVHESSLAPVRELRPRASEEELGRQFEGMAAYKPLDG